MTRPIHHSSFSIHHSPLPAIALALICAIGPVAAQGYPTGPVRVIVPFPPGGGVDGMGRILTNRLAESLGRNFPIENRSGANGNIGTELAAKAAKHGYTLLFAGSGSGSTPHLAGELFNTLAKVD